LLTLSNCEGLRPSLASRDIVATMLAQNAAAVGLAVSCAACGLALDFDGLESYPGFCSQLVPAPRFCDDFDYEQEEPFERWTLLVQQKGTASLNGDEYVSPRRSFLSTSQAFQPGGATDEFPEAFAHLELPELADKALQMTISCDFMVESFDSSMDAYVTVLSFDYDRADGGHLLDLDLVPAPGLFLALGEQNIATDESEPEQMLHGRVAGDPLMQSIWYHVDLLIDIRQPRGADNWFTLSVDGVARKTAPFTFPLAGGEPELALGITDTGASPINPWRLRFDNFVVRIEPR
jgi:hypothetical protein